MDFGERLSLLMEQQGISNTRLARALSVDASLVSKWRKGIRVPPKNSVYLERIAEFLAEQARQPHQLAALSELLNLQQDSENFRQDAVRALCSWLAGAEISSSAAVDMLLNRMSMFKAACRSETGFNQMNPEGTHGQPLAAEVYYGTEGRQKALLKFLTLVCEHRSLGRIFLYSDESTDWFLADNSFYRQWANLMVQIVAKGNKIRIIHNVQRDLGEMVLAVERWLPFYMTGAMEPYYYPKYREQAFKKTVVVRPGVAALVTTSFGGSKDTTPHCLYTDPQIVAAWSTEFDSFLKVCRPLMRILTSRNPHEFYSLVLEFTEEPADCIRVSKALSLITMPKEVFERQIENWEIGDTEKEQLCRWHQAMVASATAGLERHSYIEVLNLPASRIFAVEEIRVEPPNFLKGQAIAYSPEDYRQHLENILSWLDRYPNFHFFFNPQAVPPNMHLVAKSEVGVIVAKSDPPPIVFAFNQPNMTSAFYVYLENIVESIPARERNRKETEKRLVGLIESLQTCR